MYHPHEYIFQLEFNGTVDPALEGSRETEIAEFRTNSLLVVWLSHNPLPTTALGVLHHQHADERVWSPSIQPFVAFPKNVKI